MRGVRRTHPSVQSLREAQSARDFVTVERAMDGADQLAGYVVGLGSRWVLFSVFSGGAANGWVAVRVSDIVAVSLAPGSEFLRLGLEYRRAWPAASPRAPLALSQDARALITSASSTFPLVTLYAEGEDPHSCSIGRPLNWADDRLLFHEMNASADWEEEPSEWQFSVISRVDVGGRYETALARVARLRGV